VVPLNTVEQKFVCIYATPQVFGLSVARPKKALYGLPGSKAKGLISLVTISACFSTNGFLI